MPHDFSYLAVARLVAAVIIVLVLAIAPRAAATADETLALDVVVNGHAIGKLGEFVMRDGSLLARPKELRDLGFRVPAAAAVGRDGLLSLSALPGFAWRLDQATQTIYVTAGTNRLLPVLLQAEATSSDKLPVESGSGATLDYDVTGTSVAGQNVASGLFDLRAFSPWGVASSGLLARAGGSYNGTGAYSTVRLDSTYTYSDPDTLHRYRLGDVISGGLSWTRPVRLGGAQISADFSMRPDLVTFPLPTVGGSVAVPSTVDVLVNGTQLLSREVQPGPFAIPQLPVITGAGTVALTVTNALGRQVTTTLPFYASSALLAPGLQTFSAEAGAVRRNWGFISDDYGALAGSATFRRGLWNDLTLEAHAEGTSDLAMAGGGVVVKVGNLGVVNANAAASASFGRTGTQLSVGAQRVGRIFSVGASAIIAGRNFRDIAAMNGDPVPRLQLNANAGLSLGRFGSVGIAYTSVDRDAAPAPIPIYAPPGSVFTGSTSLIGGVYYLQPAEHTHIASASYSVQIRDVSLYATGYHDFANSHASGVLVGMTIPIGARSSVGAGLGSTSGNGSAQVQAMQSPVSIGDWGYQAYGSTGNPSHEFAELQYKSRWALVSAGADRTGQQTTMQAEVQGAFSFADGGLFASNTINDSFAVVDTNGVGHIRVLDENREVGKTDSAGRLLVPDLRSFDVNHLAIEPTDVPVDTTVPFTTRDVRPQDRSGVVVRFPLHTSHGALLHLVDASGRSVPVGSTATLESTGAVVPVGYDGAAYVQDLSRHNRLVVERPDGQRCEVVFDYRAVLGQIPVLGPLPCREKRP